MATINVTEIELSATQAATLNAALNKTISGIQALSKQASAGAVHMLNMSAAICSALAEMIGGRRGSAFAVEWLPGQGEAGCRGGVLVIPDGYVAEAMNNIAGMAWQHAVVDEADPDLAAEAAAVLRHVMNAI